MPRLSVANVTKHFGDIKAIEDVSLQVEDGEYVVILGPSGCGKSTLLKCIAGIVKNDKGSIYIDDKNIDGLPPEERRVGYVFQNIALFPNMTVWDNVSYSPRVRAISWSRYRPLVFEVLEMVKVPTELGKYPSSFSGGEAQKVSLARSLASGVELLLLDEPLSALDTRVRVQLRYELRRIVKEAHLTAVHVTHDQEEAMAIADRIVVMDHRKIVEVDRPERLYVAPDKEFTATFLGEANVMDARVIDLLPDGSLLQLGEHRLKGPRPPGGARGRCTVIVRPESVELSRTRADIRGTLSRKSFAGSYYRFEVEVGGKLLTSKASRSSSAAMLEQGETVYVRIPAESMMLFESQG